MWRRPRTVGGGELAPQQPVLLGGGEALGVGSFSFLFHTPSGFLAYLKRVVKA